jgi:hypothetical protein
MPSRWPGPATAARQGPSSMISGHVAEFAGRAVRAQQETPVAEDRAAQARRDGHVQEVAAAPGGAQPVLREGGDVGVPLEVCRHPESGFELVGE